MPSERLSGDSPAVLPPGGTDGPAPRGPSRGLWRQLGMAVGVAIAAAVSVSPWYSTSVAELVVRTVFVSFVLVGVYIGVQRWPQRWLPPGMPRWMLIVLAVGLAAPLATFAVYLISLRGDVIGFVTNDARMRGFTILAVLGLVLGVVFALGAMLRQREAEAQAQVLQFELERSRLERQALDARLSLLQAQIQPHFLFNTLANVQALVESGSPRAADVLKTLIEYLRAAMPRLQGGTATLGEELTLVRAYLQLMQMRMPDRMDFALQVEESLRSQPFPALALLTLVENAVQHGIDPSLDGGRVVVGVRLDAAAGTLRAWVEDSGVGLDPKAEPGTGLQNLRARLEALHGPAASVSLSEVAPHGVRAEIQLPAA